jgi:hypothetical protein
MVADIGRVVAGGAKSGKVLHVKHVIDSRDIRDVDPPDLSAGQVAVRSQDTAPESTQENNGFDLTRPQSSFEVRGLDQTSSNDTSKTNKAQMLLRVESKIPLDTDWRLGVLAQVPLVQKTTTDFEPQSVDHEFGLGDANFQVIVAHAIDERWAFGVGARVAWPTTRPSQSRA